MSQTFLASTTSSGSMPHAILIARALCALIVPFHTGMNHPLDHAPLMWGHKCRLGSPPTKGVEIAAAKTKAEKTGLDIYPRHNHLQVSLHNLPQWKYTHDDAQASHNLDATAGADGWQGSPSRTACDD